MIVLCKKDLFQQRFIFAACACKAKKGWLMGAIYMSFGFHNSFTLAKNKKETKFGGCLWKLTTKEGLLAKNWNIR